MKFVEVKEAPKMGYKRNELQARLNEFMRMRTKTVKVIWEGTYKSAQGAQCNISRAAKVGGFPIDVRRIKGEVYLIRRDM